jgi:hypothetical protein
MPVFRRNIPCPWGCLVLASSLAAPGVRADPLDAKDMFAQARGLPLQGQCARSLPLFRRAYAMYPAGLGSLRNIAECEEELGHFASARRAWLDLQLALSTRYAFQLLREWASEGTSPSCDTRPSPVY